MDNNEKLLQEVYKNVKMGQDSIIDLLDKVDDNSLRGEMTSQLETYKGYANKVSEKLKERGLKPKEISPASKVGSKIGMAFNTMIDTTTSHLAEMMINGATMGIIDLEKQLNDGNYSTDAKSIAEEVLHFEKNTVEKLGTFL
jgi:anti-sigma28 factor (negative regulator of flagellin synthesis)